MRWVIGIPALILLTFVAEIAAEIVAEGFLDYLDDKEEVIQVKGQTDV